MPSNIKNRPLTVDIQEYITQIILQHPNHTVILCRDFNRNIALIGRKKGNTTTVPIQQDVEWKQFIETLHLQYIPTDTNYSYQGSNNYTLTSLIDGFYIKTQQNPPNTSTFISKTILSLK